METEITAILDKLQRAFRNKTGTTFSPSELRTLAKLGVLHMLAKASADEIVAGLDPQAPELTKRSVDRPVYSVRTLSERWQCSEGLVRSMISRGELRSFRHGNLIRIKAEAVQEVEDRRDSQKGLP